MSQNIMSQLSLFSNELVLATTNNEDGKHTSSATPIKQELVAKVFKLNIEIIFNILRKHNHLDKRYQYFDLNAGIELIDNKNGAMSFLKSIAEHRRRNSHLLKFRAILIDNNELNLSNLREKINEFIETFKSDTEKQYFRKAIKMYNEDHQVVMEKWLKVPYNKEYVYGMLYHDPFGEPSFDLLEKFSHLYSRIDILLNCNCCQVKRDLKNKVCKNELRLQEHIDNIDKKYLVCSTELLSCWQFWLMIFTNWNKYPKQKGINVTQYDKGTFESLMTKANFTKKEIKDNAISINFRD